MNVPTLSQALGAIQALTGTGPAIAAAEGLFGIVADLFDKPDDRAKVDAEIAKVRASTDAALDRLDAAIDDRIDKAGK